MSRLFRSIVLSTVLALATIAGTAVVTPQQANAATAVSFCFKWADGGAYRNQPVFLMNREGTRKLRDGRTNSTGCGTFFNTPSNQPLIVRAYVRLANGLIYSGDTPNYATAGAGGVRLGEGIVRYFSYL